MRLVYLLLSPTFGMHQYTADLANRMSQAGHDVHLVTTEQVPRDRYAPHVQIHAPVNTSTTGFSLEGLRLSAIRNSQFTIHNLNPDVVHVTGVHLWNVPIVWDLRRHGIPVIHTLHDLDPHHGVRWGSLIRLWNRLIIGSISHVLVHGRHYRERLIAGGVAPECVTHTPLLHLFLSHQSEFTIHNTQFTISYEPFALFFGRLQRYKGVEYLITASAMLNGQANGHPRVVLAGPGHLPSLWAGALPPYVEVHDELILDDEAVDLFQRCSLVVLPYLDATQSALVAAAYFFRKPVIVTRVGALQEYVEEGRTGWVVEPEHPAGLARCLETALADPDRLARMGAAGRAWYDHQRQLERETLLRMYHTVATAGER